MTENTKTPRSGIVAAITLMLRTIAKENTHSRPRRKFGTLNGWKKYKANTTKSPQVTIKECTGTKTYKEVSGRSVVDEVH